MSQPALSALQSAATHTLPTSVPTPPPSASSASSPSNAFPVDAVDFLPTPPPSPSPIPAPKSPPHASSQSPPTRPPPSPLCLPLTLLPNASLLDTFDAPDLSPLADPGASSSTLRPLPSASLQSDAAAVPIASHSTPVAPHPLDTTPRSPLVDPLQAHLADDPSTILASRMAPPPDSQTPATVCALDGYFYDQTAFALYYGEHAPAVWSRALLVAQTIRTAIRTFHAAVGAFQQLAAWDARFLPPLEALLFLVHGPNAAAEQQRHGASSTASLLRKLLLRPLWWRFSFCDLTGTPPDAVLSDSAVTAIWTAWRADWLPRHLNAAQRRAPQRQQRSVFQAWIFRACGVAGPVVREILRRGIQRLPEVLFILGSWSFRLPHFAVPASVALAPFHTAQARLRDAQTRLARAWASGTDRAALEAEVLRAWEAFRPHLERMCALSGQNPSSDLEQRLAAALPPGPGGR